MNKDIKKLADGLNAAKEVDIEGLLELVGSFSESTDEDNDMLVHSLRAKLAEVFSLEKLKGLDRHFISPKIMNLMLSAETVADYENIGTYITSMDGSPAPILVQVFSIKLSDGAQIHAINIQEETNLFHRVGGL